MTKKQELEVPDYNEKDLCDNCGSEGAAFFNTELLCKDCVSKDVFETINERMD